MQEKTQNIIGIYHKDCVDGTAAAAVLLKKFPGTQTFPLHHHYSSNDLSPILDAANGAEHMYTLDCTLGVREFLEAGHKVTVIDHHVGGKEEMEALAKENNNLVYVFDNEKSGASLSWSYFFPEVPTPEVIALVEDSDLWKWRFGDETKYINNYLTIFLNEPEKVSAFFDTIPRSARDGGKTISQFTDRLVRHYTSRINSLSMHVGEHIVPVFNITSFQSQCGNILSRRLDSVVGMFILSGGIVDLSFRSLDHHEPTSLQIAKLMSGGGHKNAAGAQVELKDFLKMLKN